jgi:hypothetical protein
MIYRESGMALFQVLSVFRVQGLKKSMKIMVLVAGSWFCFEP